MLLPKLKLNDIKAVASRLAGTQGSPHIWPVGFKDDLKGQKHGTQALYLTEALEARLTSSFLKPCYRTNLQAFFLEAIEKEGAVLLPFRDFSTARTYLASRPSASLVRHDPGFVSHLREQELTEVRQLLNEERMVVLVGPPEAGKSTFARELIQAEGGDYRDIRLIRRKTVQEVCYALAETLDEDLSGSFSEETLIQRIAEKPYIFWIKGCDVPSYKYLVSFLSKVCTLRVSLGIASKWIIESTEASDQLLNCNHFLEPLEDGKIIHLLDSAEAGGAFNDPNIVVKQAQGRPGYALRLWRSDDAQQAEVTDEYEWFYRQLPHEEATMLSLLCFAASKSPLGFTQESLNQWAMAVLPHKLKSDIRKTNAALLEKLEERRLADVIRLDQETVDTFLNTALPDDYSMVVIDNVASGLVHHALISASESDKAKWDQLLRAELENTYLLKETDLSLTHITLELIYGDHLGRDLVPFFQSPFRFTHLRRLLQWIETTSWVPTSPKQAYFYKSLRILSQLSKGFYIDVDDELGLPTANDLNQQFAHDLVQTRVSLCQIDGSFDLQAWKTVCEGCADSQLQAEQYISRNSELG